MSTRSDTLSGPTALKASPRQRLPAVVAAPVSVWSNGMRSLARVNGRLRRPVAAGMPPIVSPAMVSAMIAAVALTMFAAAFDPFVALWIRESDWTLWLFLHGVTDAAKSHFYLVPAGVIALLLGLIDWRAVRRSGTRARMILAYGRSAFIFVAIAGPGIAINVIKQFVGRGRPRGMDEYGPHVFSPFEFTYLFQSFPSGHATTAGSLGMLIALWYPRHAALALVGAAALAFARVPANAHYLSDVVAGYAIGTLATLALARWLARRSAVFRFVPGAPLPALTAGRRPPRRALALETTTTGR